MYRRKKAKQIKTKGVQQRVYLMIDRLSEIYYKSN